jgi:hypothetical protein
MIYLVQNIPVSKHTPDCWLFFIHECEVRLYGSANHKTQALCDALVKKGKSPSMFQQDTIRSLGVQTKADEKLVVDIYKVLEEHGLKKDVEASQHIQNAALVIAKLKDKKSRVSKHKVQLATTVLNSYKSTRGDQEVADAAQPSGSDGDDGSVYSYASDDDSVVSLFPQEPKYYQASAATSQSQGGTASPKSKKQKSQGGTGKRSGAAGAAGATARRNVAFTTPGASPPGQAPLGGAAGATSNPGTPTAAGASTASTAGMKSPPGTTVTPPPGGRYRPCEHHSTDPAHGICDPAGDFGGTACGVYMCIRCKGNGNKYAPSCVDGDRCGYFTCPKCIAHFKWKMP